MRDSSWSKSEYLKMKKEKKKERYFTLTYLFISWNKKLLNCDLPYLFYKQRVADVGERGRRKYGDDIEDLWVQRLSHKMVGSCP